MGEYVERGERVPQVALRGHVHLSRDTYDNHTIRALTTPCFMGSGEYGKVVSDALPDIGGFIFICEGGRYQLKKVPFKPKARRVWRISQ